MSTRGDWGGRLHVFSFVPSRGTEPSRRGGDPILWGSLRPLKLRALGEGRTKSREGPLVIEVVISGSDDVYVERNRRIERVRGRRRCPGWNLVAA